MRVEEVLTQQAGHGPPVMAVHHVVLARRCLPGRASGPLQLVQVKWRQRLASCHRLADAHEALRHRLAGSVEEIATQVLPAADAADDPVGRDLADAAVNARDHAPSIADRLIEAADTPVPAAQAFDQRPPGHTWP